MPTLIVLAGLPGTGKSTIARALAAASGATWLRIDSIEQAIRDAGVVPGSLDDAGYRAAYAVAADNLRLGRDVIADSVNPIALTRAAWRGVAADAGSACLDVEVVCSDRAKHRRRVEGRVSEVAGLVPPTWSEVTGREYHLWDGERLVIDTATVSLDQAVEQVLARLARTEPTAKL